MLTDKRTVVLLLAITALAAEKKPERRDLYGDPLPPGTIARLGTVRGRLPDVVESCAFSRDGKILVAAGGDAAIHLFEAATGRPLRQLHHHKANVTCLSFSPDGKILASGSEDGSICLSDWPSGKVLRQFPTHKIGLRSLVFAGTGKFLVSGSAHKWIHLWDVATGRELRQLQGHEKAAEAIAVSPDGRLVASSSQSFVRLWDTASGRLLHQHKTDVYWIQSLAFSPDSKLVAFPVGTLKIALWDVATGKIVRRLDGKRSGSISAVAFSPDGRIVASAAADYSLVLWDTATGKLLHQLPGKHLVRYPGGINSLAFSPDGRRLAFGEDHCLRLWDLDAWQEIHPVEGHANRIYRVVFSRDNKTLVTAADDTANTLQEWDAATGKKRRTLWRQRLMGRHGFHLSPDHTVLTTVDYEENGLLLRSRNIITRKEIHRVKLPFNQEGGYNPAMIVLSPDGKIITSQSREEHGHPRPVLLRDTTTGKTISKLSGIHGWFRFSPDSGILACTGERGDDGRKQINLYDVSRSRFLWKLPLAGENYVTHSLAFSLDSRLVAAASSNSDDASRNRLDVWETVTGQKRITLSTSRTTLIALAFSPDGALLAAGDSEGVIHLWSLASGKEVRQLQGHRGTVESLAFSHDGKLLASGSWDTTALIWDIREAAEAAWPHLADVPRERLERLWADLAGDDGVRVHRALWGLVAARPVMPWLQDHLKPVLPADAQRIARLIADLDSDTFTVREKATRELEEMGETVEPALRKVLADKPSLELRRRVEPMVKKLDSWPASSSAALRDWRALEVLEHLGTSEARRLLGQLAEGAPEARLTREAKAALRRLAARLDTMP